MGPENLSPVESWIGQLLSNLANAAIGFGAGVVVTTVVMRKDTRLQRMVLPLHDELIATSSVWRAMLGQIREGRMTQEQAMFLGLCSIAAAILGGFIVLAITQAVTTLGTPYG